MKNVVFLAYLTFKGIIRERTFYFLVLLAFLFFFLTPYLTAVIPRQGIQVALDFVMSTVSFVGLILAVFFGSGLISKDVDKKTIYSIITKPISRQGYILGRFLGLALVLLVTTLLFTAFGLLSYYVTVNFFNPMGENPSWFLFSINLLFTLEMLLLLVAFSFLVSTVSTSSFLPLAVTIFVYYAGQSTSTVKALFENVKATELTSVLKTIVNAAYYIMPNLTLFDLKVKAAYNLPVATTDLLLICLYGIIYIVILLSMAIKIFNKRDIA